MIKPDLIIGHNYLHRWYLIPRNRFFNIYLHKFIGSDDDRGLHDHPWWSISFLLKGELIEYCKEKKGLYKPRWVSKFIPVFRKAKHAHRLVLHKGPAWTVFITGPRVRTWGFHCGDRWVPWQLFTSKNEKGVERRCD